MKNQMLLLFPSILKGGVRGGGGGVMSRNSRINVIYFDFVAIFVMENHGVMRISIFLAWMLGLTESYLSFYLNFLMN